MRELKFRAWDGVEGKMAKLLVLAFIDGRAICDYEGMPMKVKMDELIIEQFTGLKDKNGKEIYEGDIVHEAYSEKKWKDYKVKFERGEFNVSHAAMCFVSVIGNIHENPELLR